MLEVARAILEEDTDYALSEAVAKIDERDDSPVTELTRRRIVALFAKRSLSTELPELEMIQRIWPVGHMPSVFDNSQGTLEEDLIQHTVRNYDWDGTELLGYLGLLTCSRAQLFKFLSEVVGPVSQTPEVQAELGELERDVALDAGGDDRVQDLQVVLDGGTRLVHATRRLVERQHRRRSGAVLPRRGHRPSWRRRWSRIQVAAAWTWSTTAAAVTPARGVISSNPP